MSQSTNLQLPYLAPGQAQKHVTVSESIRRLDAIVNLSVVTATTTAEPVSPVDGAVYIVPAGKTGSTWGAFANESLGYYRDGAWEQITPREGWTAFVRDTDSLLFFTGAAWAAFPAGKLLAVSATDRLLGRSTAGAGAAEEIACTAAGRALIDDADAAAQRATLGLGGAAVLDRGATISVLFKLVGADLASTADQPFTKVGSFTNWRAQNMLVTNLSGAANGAVGGVYTGAGKTGSAVIAASTAYTALTGSTAGQIFGAANGNGMGTQTATPCLSLTTPHGSAVTGDVYLGGFVLD